MPGNWEFRTEWRREKLSLDWSLGKRGATGWSRAQDELEGESYPGGAGGGQVQSSGKLALVPSEGNVGTSRIW